MRKTDFLIIDADNEALFDAMSEKFTAKVIPICGRNFFKVEIETGEGETSDFFNGGIYQDKQTAQREVKRLYRTLKQFKQGKRDVNAFQFADSDVSVLELLTLVEIYSELDRAKKLRGAKLAAVDDVFDAIDEFLNKLRRDHLMKGRCSP